MKTFLKFTVLSVVLLMLAGLMVSCDDKHAHDYVKNELIIRLKGGVDAEEFAINSNLGITPKELLAERWNTWLFKTDGTRSLNELIEILSKDPDVVLAQRNHTDITPRNE